MYVSKLNVDENWTIGRTSGGFATVGDELNVLNDDLKLEKSLIHWCLSDLPNEGDAGNSFNGNNCLLQWKILRDLDFPVSIVIQNVFHCSSNVVA